MRVIYKSLILILIIFTQMFTIVIGVNFNASSIFEKPNHTNATDSKSPNNASGIWYLPDLSEINPRDIVLEFKIIEGGLVHIDESDNFRVNGAIELTNNYFKIENNDESNIFGSDSFTMNGNTELLEVQNVWDQGYAGENAVVAVVDTGIDFSHPSLIGKRFAEKSFVTKEIGYPADESVEDFIGHGTSVSGLIAGKDPDHEEYHGVAYEASLVSAKVANSQQTIYSSGLLAALDWVGTLKEVDIINLSLGELEESPATDLLEQMANEVVKRGKLLVGSAGNSGKNGKNGYEPFTIGSPGSAVEAISVGAIDFSKNLASASSEGPTMGWEVKPDFVAPGVNVMVPKLSTNYTACSGTSCYQSVDGTSFSTPIMSGVMALAVSALIDNDLPNNPGIVKGSAHTASSTTGLPWYQEGSGLVNVTKMVNILLNGKYRGVILPKGDHHPKISTIPAGESVKIPITVIGDSLAPWISYNEEGNASSFTSVELDETKTGYSQIVYIVVEPIDNVTPSSYIYNFTIFNLLGVSLSSSIDLTVIAPTKYRLLLDLAHTPWDSVFHPSAKLRLERILGYDTQDLIDIFLKNGVWVDELLTGTLTRTILDKYDIIWMPSVFVDPIQPVTDREPLRSQKITSEELFSLYQFKNRGGKFIIDFGGRTVNDGEKSFHTTVSDASSLESLLSLFGIRVSNIINYQGYQNGFINPDLNFATAKYETTFGVINMHNGIPILKNGTINYIAGFIGENKDMAFIANTRNWRDNSRLSDNQINGPRQFAEAVANWITNGDRISSLSLNLIEEKLEFSLMLNETIDPSKIIVDINSSQGLHELLNVKINGRLLTSTINSGTQGVYTMTIKYGSEKTIFQREIDYLAPSIEVKLAHQAHVSSGEIQTTWNIIISDNEKIPTYNKLITTSENIDEVTINLKDNGYSITASNSYIENNEVNVLLEVIDSLGQYKQLEINLGQLLLKGNVSTDQNDNYFRRNLIPIIGSAVIISAMILTYSIIRKRKMKID